MISDVAIANAVVVAAAFFCCCSCCFVVPQSHWTYSILHILFILRVAASEQYVASGSYDTTVCRWLDDTTRSDLMLMGLLQSCVLSLLAALPDIDE